MVNFRSVSAALAATALIGEAVAHPGEHHTEAQIKREVAAHRHAHRKMARAMGSCANNPSYVKRQEQAVARRAEVAKGLRQKRGLESKPMIGKRDQEALEKWMAVSHDSTSEGYTLDTPASTLFSGNATCALVEETTIGPYWVAGELVREDITEGQAGVPLHVEVQFVDVADCSAVADMMIDVWHCNATGVYSGVSSTGQGGLNSTWLRGAQVSDADGVASFDTVFPGHYTGRATHIHVLSTKDANVLPNSTYDGGVATHIGQFFFDQDLISLVEATEPYTSNAQELTTNAGDDIAAGEATDDYDVFMDYALLGGDVTDGILAWIVVGVDSAANVTDSVQAAAHYYKGGGVDTSSGMGGGPGGPPGAGGNGTGPGASSSAPLPVATSGAVRRFY
ncbi:Intradiol ring-cleavage dioxygenase [Xylariomycetidae sp. FL2044]|nr:Intradiol ring-cleavage dioxygenase [Xylariomycetidae sp. FL2044]